MRMKVKMGMGMARGGRARLLLLRGVVALSKAVRVGKMLGCLWMMVEML